MSFKTTRIPEYPCPHCGKAVDLAEHKPLTEIPCPHCSQAMPVPVKYRSMLVLKKIAEGGGSNIFLGEDRVLGRKVALKVLKIASEDRVSRQEAVDEGRSLMMLDHKNIVKVFALDTHSGTPSFIMELMTGGSLKDKMNEGPVDELFLLKATIDTIKGLRAAAKHGLYHLDVKPQNIMFDDDGTAKVLDFGYALFGIDDMVAKNQIPGTPYYVSPEMIQRMDPDERADMYSLGCTLFHALTGEPPFKGDDIKQIIMVRMNDIVPNIRDKRPDLHPKTAALVDELLEPDRADRPMNYDELLRQVREAHLSVELIRQKQQA